MRSQQIRAYRHHIAGILENPRPVATGVARLFFGQARSANGGLGEATTVKLHWQLSDNNRNETFIFSDGA